MDILSLVLATAGGVLIAVIGFFVGKKVIAKYPDKYAFVSMGRIIVTVIYLIGLFFLAKAGIGDSDSMLIGGALGVTLPTFAFTASLMKDLDSKKKSKEENPNG